MFAAALVSCLALVVPFSQGSGTKRNLDQLRGDMRLMKEFKLRVKRTACKDKSSYCNVYKPYCNEAEYKDYLKKNCQKTCDLCGCSDKISYCKHYESECENAAMASSLKHYCRKTCGFCQGNGDCTVTTLHRTCDQTFANTAEPPTTPPRTEQPIDQGSVECGTKILNTRVVGGATSRPGAWPWQVSITNDKSLNTSSHLCGGSIVTPLWIVSAAHCFLPGDDPQKYSVIAGEFDLKENEGREQHMKIDKIIAHSKYDHHTHDYDLALIKLQSPLSYNDHVRPVCLPKVDFAVSTKCYVKGWGHTEYGRIGSQTLQEAQVPLVSRKTCQAAYSKISHYTITARMRCAGYAHGGIDACQGDSGGSLVCSRDGKWYMIGVVSWGLECARKGIYGVYADLMDLKYWVQETINTK